MCPFGTGQRGHGKLLFTLNVQYSTAGYKNLQVRATAQQFRQSWSRLHHLLEVIHQQQEMFVSQEGFHIVHMFRARSLPRMWIFHAEYMGKRVNDHPGIADRSQWDKAGTIGKYVE